MPRLDNRGWEPFPPLFGGSLQRCKLLWAAVWRKPVAPAPAEPAADMELAQLLDEALGGAELPAGVLDLAAERRRRRADSPPPREHGGVCHVFILPTPKD